MARWIAILWAMALLVGAVSTGADPSGAAAFSYHPSTDVFVAAAARATAEGRGLESLEARVASAVADPPKFYR